MGILLLESGRRFPLRARCRVGRASDNDLVLSSGPVSRDHALIAWGGDGWELRDLGSHNGCFVDGFRLPTGGRALLHEGSLVGFGTSNQARLVDAAPPEPMASADDGGEVVGVDGELVLEGPDPEGAEDAVIWREDDGSWRMETGGSASVVTEGATVRVGDRSWTLWLPDPAEALPTAPESDRSEPAIEVALDGGVFRPTERTLLRDGRPVPLSPIEARLLVYFVGQPRRAVSHRELLSEVWGYRKQVESRTVYVTINRLRHKVERDPAVPRHLLAVPGVGYRFVPGDQYSKL